MGRLCLLAHMYTFSYYQPTHLTCPGMTTPKVGIVAHFKPFTRAKSGPPAHRSSTNRSWEDSSTSHHHRKYRRYRSGGLLNLNIGLGL